MHTPNREKSLIARGLKSWRIAHELEEKPSIRNEATHLVEEHGLDHLSVALQAEYGHGLI